MMLDSEAGLQGEQIVHFAHGPWHDIWRDRQHIFSRLARENMVLYVEPNVYWLKDVRQGQVAREAWQQPRLQWVQDGLWLYRHPAWAPRTPRSGLNTLTRALRRLALHMAMRRLNIHNPIVWLYQPKDAELVGMLDERLLVYQIVDEYAAFQHYTPAEQRAIREAEQRLGPRADLVIVSSTALFESKRSLNANVQYVPNGVDYTAFERFRQSGAPLPDDIAALPRPIIGYSGHISYRLDFAALGALARARPAWSIVLVGSVWEHGCEAALASLRTLPNVHFLGQKPPDAVPAYLHAFDVGLIPYLPGEEARNINPIKLYEYLAAGKPIVSVELPALDGFRHLVRVAVSADDFVAQATLALGEQNEDLVARRRQLAAENTWDQRAALTSRLVRQCLTTKFAGGWLASGEPARSTFGG